MWLKETITTFMLYKHKTICKNKTRENVSGKLRFVDVSSVLDRHTLQQGDVVSFQHDPP